MTESITEYLRRRGVQPAREEDHREAKAINDIFDHMMGDPVLAAHFQADQKNSLAQFVIDYINRGA